MKFDAFMESLKPQLEKLAKKTVKEAADAAAQTGIGFVRSLEADVSGVMFELLKWWNKESLALAPSAAPLNRIKDCFFWAGNIKKRNETGRNHKI